MVVVLAFKVILSSNLVELHDKMMIIRKGMKVIEFKKSILNREFKKEEEKKDEEQRDDDSLRNAMTTTDGYGGGSTHSSDVEEDGEEGWSLGLERLRLIHKGRIMKDNDLVDRYDIQEGDKLHVVHIKEDKSKDSLYGHVSSHSMTGTLGSGSSSIGGVAPEMKLLGDMMKIPEFKVFKMICV